jgi:hypothetical protein
MNDTAYASYRVLVKFNGTSTTDVKDMMYDGVASRSSGPCQGLYNRTLFTNVAELWSKGPFAVSQNGALANAHRKS